MSKGLMFEPTMGKLMTMYKYFLEKSNDCLIDLNQKLKTICNKQLYYISIYTLVI